MIFLNFSQLPESVFRPKLKENTFLKTKPNFSLTGKFFSLTNFHNNKQTRKSLENGFQKTIFHQTNKTLKLICKCLSNDIHVKLTCIKILYEKIICIYK
jgi:hypothetical protein